MTIMEEDHFRAVLDSVCGEVDVAGGLQDMRRTNVTNGMRAERFDATDARSGTFMKNEISPGKLADDPGNIFPFEWESSLIYEKRAFIRARAKQDRTFNIDVSV
jgi:hypothetical protein